MPSEEDILFGQLAVERGYLQAHQVKECLDTQEALVRDHGMNQEVRASFPPGSGYRH